MKVKDIIKEFSKFDENLDVTFFIQNRENYLKENDVFFCNKMYINTDADGNEVYCIGNHKE